MTEFSVTMLTVTITKVDFVASLSCYILVVNLSFAVIINPVSIRRRKPLHANSTADRKSS